MVTSNVTNTDVANPVSSPHAVPGEEVMHVMQSSAHGLSHKEAAARIV